MEDKNIDSQNIEESQIDYKDKYLRALAELENYKKQVNDRIYNLTEFKNEEALKALLSICDLSEKVKELEKEYLKDGDINVLPYIILISSYKSLVKEFDSTVAKLGLTKMETDGKQFNPDIHEAFTKIYDETKENNEIIQTFKTGYTYKDKIIRYPKVVVNEI